MKKRIVFLIERSPWHDDQAYHFVRMALSLAVDAEPAILFAETGSVVRKLNGHVPDGCPDIAGQLRLFAEMVGPAYWTDWGRCEGCDSPSSDLVAYLPARDAIELIRGSHSLVRC